MKRSSKIFENSFQNRDSKLFFTFESFISLGKIWIEDAPVPISAILFPSSFGAVHSAECTIWPLNFCISAKFAIEGFVKAPIQDMIQSYFSVFSWFWKEKLCLSYLRKKRWTWHKNISLTQRSPIWHKYLTWHKKINSTQNCQLR